MQYWYKATTHHTGLSDTVFSKKKQRVNDNMDLIYVNNILKNGEKR